MAIVVKKAVNETAYVKAEFFGLSGSGKSRTAAEFAIGLSRQVSRPVFFLDTETGSDKLVHVFEAAEVELFAHKSRAFTDLVEFVEVCARERYIGIIDSVSHFWAELVETYQTDHKKRKLEIQDWVPIKKEWGRFTAQIVNAPAHLIICGRAADLYQSFENEEGKREMMVAGTKMQAEKSTTFEPDLVVEMTVVQRAPRRVKKDGKKQMEGKKLVNVALVLKDRFDEINGQEIDFPTFEDFEPFVKHVNIGGANPGIDLSRTSAGLFGPNGEAFEAKRRRVEQALDEIKECLMLRGWDGNSTEAKAKRAPALIAAFGTSAWPVLEAMDPERLRVGVRLFRKTYNMPTPPATTCGRWEDEVQPQAQAPADDDIPETHATVTAAVQATGNAEVPDAVKAILVKIADIATIKHYYAHCKKHRAEYDALVEPWHTMVYTALEARGEVLGVPVEAFQQTQEGA